MPRSALRFRQPALLILIALLSAAPASAGPVAVGDAVPGMVAPSADAVRPAPAPRRAVPARGRLAGRVTRDGGAAPVRHAYLSPTEVESEVRSGDDGGFVYPSLKPGWHELRALALGFAERRFRVLVEDGWTTLVEVDLGASLADPGPGAAPPANAADASPDAGGPPFVPERALSDSTGPAAPIAGTPRPGAVPIRFTVPAAADTLAARLVTVEVADRSGRRVRGLAARPLPPGRYLLGWDGTDDAGRAVPPGYYGVRVRVDGEVVAASPTRTP